MMQHSFSTVANGLWSRYGLHIVHTLFQQLPLHVGTGITLLMYLRFLDSRLLARLLQTVH